VHLINPPLLETVPDDIFRDGFCVSVAVILGIMMVKYKRKINTITKRQAKSMKKIWLIRHGESIANAGEATQDHTSIPLSPTGICQAQELAQRIPPTPELIVTSPYLRAQQTALQTIGRYPGTATGIWDCIHEFVYLAPKTCVGTTSVQRRPRVISYWRKLDPDYVDGEGAESYRQLIDRIQLTLSILEHRPEQYILLFTHAQFIRNFLLVYENPNRPVEEYMAAFRHSEPVRNCQIKEVTM
jgi:broad specificity phosphatase PhoE